MENKGFRLAIVIALGIFLGVLVVSKQREDAMLTQILNRQTQLLNAQAKLEAKLGGGQDSGLVRDLFQSQIEQLTAKINGLEARLASLEARPAAALPQPMAQRPMPAQPPMPAPDTVHNIPVAHSVPGGAKNGKVVITEFVDYQCPFCSRFHSPMVEAAKAFPGQVTYLLKHFPLSFHPEAKPAAKAALAAGEQGKFWEMTDLLMANQQQLGQKSYDEFAKDLGLNVKKFQEDLKNKDADYEKVIQADMQLGSQVGVRGTPSFYINGRVSTARDVGTWKSEIQQILDKK